MKDHFSPLREQALKRLCERYLDEEYEYRASHQPDGISGADPRRLEFCEHEAAAWGLVQDLTLSGIAISARIKQRIEDKMTELCPDCQS